MMFIVNVKASGKDLHKYTHAGESPGVTVLRIGLHRRIDGQVLFETGCFQLCKIQRML